MKADFFYKKRKLKSLGRQSCNSMKANRAELFYASRVRNGVRKPCEYNKEKEVSCQIINISKRDDVYSLLEQIQFGYNNIEGLVTRPGRFIDFTLKTKQHALT